MILDMAVRELGRKRGRTTLTIVGMAVGILLVTTLSSFSEGINVTVNREMAYLSGMVMVLQEGSGWASFELSEIDESVMDEIRYIGGVERVSGAVMGSVPGIGSVYGFEPGDLDMFDIDIGLKEGRMVEEDSEEVALGFNFAEHTGYRIGDEMRIRGKKYDVVGIFEETGSEEDSGVMTSLTTAQDILRKDGKLTIIMVKPVKVDEAKNVAEEINRRYDHLMAGTEEDARKEAESFVGEMNMMTFAMGSIAAIIAGLGIMNVMFMSVRERRREIGTMKALGATTYTILAEIVFESVILALAGAGIGIALSYFVVEAINTELGLMGMAVITPALLIWVTVFAVSLGVIGGILPAREAARLQPAVVLRYE